MELWLQILVGAALVIAIGAGIAFIGFILSARRLLTAAEHSLNDLLRLAAELRRSLIPAIENWTAVAHRLEETLRAAEPGLNSFRYFADTLRAIADRCHSVEERIYRRLVPPLEEITALISGVLKAVTTFVRFFTNRSRQKATVP